MVLRHEIPEQNYEVSAPVEVCSIEQKVTVNRSYKFIGVVGNRNEAYVFIRKLVKKNPKITVSDFRVLPWKVSNAIILEDK